MDVNDNKLTRSEFVKGLLVFIAGIWTAMASMPVFSYLYSGVRKSANEKSDITSLSLGPVDDFIPGSSKNFKFGSIPALLVRNEDGQFYAYNAICTHLGCTVQHSKEKNKIWCACHGGQFDTTTGTNISGPPPKPLKKLKVEVQSGEIIILKS